MLALRIVVPADIEDQMAHRIGGVIAIREDVVERLEASDGLVLPEGDEQIGKFVLWNFELPDRFGQGNKDGMFGAAVIAGIELALPLTEQFEWRSAVPNFISKIVGNPAVGVNIVAM